LKKRKKKKSSLRQAGEETKTEKGLEKDGKQVAPLTRSAKSTNPPRRSEKICRK